MMHDEEEDEDRRYPPHFALLDDALVSCGPIQVACSLLFALITCLLLFSCFGASPGVGRYRAMQDVSLLFILEILCVKQTILGPGKLAGFCSSCLVVFTCVLVAIALNPQSPRDSRLVLLCPQMTK